MNTMSRVVAALAASFALFGAAQAEVPGITGTTFNLVAATGTVSEPDGAMIYTWGYGCDPSAAAPSFLPAVTGTTPHGAPNAYCPRMQLPGPTLIVHEGDLVTVNLTNLLPGAAGPTSIVFPGQQVTATGGQAGTLTTEAGASDCGGANCNKVSYSFTAGKPGTYAYYSGSRPEVQIEMGMFGALIVLPTNPGEGLCDSGQGPYSLSTAAYDHRGTCYDREYLFQFNEFSSDFHSAVKAAVDACGASTCPFNVDIEPYRANYYMINGRAMPDLMDTTYAAAYPNQPYNANPHIHPAEKLLMRNIGQGRWVHPLHFHANHARVIARDARMLVSAADPKLLAGSLEYTLSETPGQTVDMIFRWTGQGLNWDIYGGQAHTCNGVALADAAAAQADPSNPANATVMAHLTQDNGGFDPATHEYCPDHGKPIPVTPPDPNIVANGQWYGGTPYLGLSGFDPTNLAPGTLNQNPEAGYAYMWHSHNEREITTNDVFPGGMLMMLLIDPYTWTIDESL